MRSTIAAVITTFRPDTEFLLRLSPISDYCDYVIIIDNTPGGHAFLGIPENVILIQDGYNSGLGNALNRGLKKVRELGAEVVFLFDQDSTPTEAILAGLRQGLDQYGNDKVIVGPTHQDDQIQDREENAKRIAWKQGNITCLPTSGIALNPLKLEEEDVFSESLFLDFVDFEWCWRLRIKGWAIRKLSEVVMLHRLGLAERYFMGLKFHVPAPYRHYFQFRDTLRLLTLGYVPMRSKIRLLILLPIKLVIYPLILDRGGQRFKWMVIGIIDALRSVTGIGAAAKKLN
jgi:rhamnosyltransferase